VAPVWDSTSVPSLDSLYTAFPFEFLTSAMLLGCRLVWRKLSGSNGWMAGNQIYETLSTKSCPWLCSNFSMVVLGGAIGMRHTPYQPRSRDVSGPALRSSQRRYFYHMLLTSRTNLLLYVSPSKGWSCPSTAGTRPLRFDKYLIPKWSECMSCHTYLRYLRRYMIASNSDAIWANTARIHRFIEVAALCLIKLKKIAFFGTSFDSCMSS
jgi:hypothetical protein